MTIHDHNLTAERIIDMQYDDDLYDYNSIRGYLDEYLGTTSPADIPEDIPNWHPLLKAALSADIKDWLSNGNELLDNEDDDYELVKDDTLRGQICSLIAAKLLARIYPS